MFHSLQSTIKVNPFVGSFENEALENEDRSTKHPNLENEAPKNSKTKTPKLETGLSFINTRQCLANTAGIKHDNVRVLRASLTLRFQTRFRPFLLVPAHTCIRQNTVSFEVYINMYVYQKKLHIKIRCIKHSETNNKINTGYPI